MALFSLSLSLAALFPLSCICSAFLACCCSRWAHVYRLRNGSGERSVSSSVPLLSSKQSLLSLSAAAVVSAVEFFWSVLWVFRLLLFVSVFSVLFTNSGVASEAEEFRNSTKKKVVDEVCEGLLREGIFPFRWRSCSKSGRMIDHEKDPSDDRFTSSVMVFLFLYQCQDCFLEPRCQVRLASGYGFTTIHRMSPAGLQRGKLNRAVIWSVRNKVCFFLLCSWRWSVLNSRAAVLPT